MQILLFSPNFFSYHLLIKKELENLGHEVDWIDDRGDSNFLERSVLRIIPKLGVQILKKKFFEKINALNDRDYQLILVIKGEGLSEDFLNFIRDRFKKSKLNFYLWDSVENAKNSLEISRLFDCVYTFDPVDAEKYQWNYLPLFAKNIEKTIVTDKYFCDISFIGTLHSNRNEILTKIYKKYNKKYNLFFHLYSKNNFLILYNMLFDISIFRNTNFLSKKPMPFIEYQNFIAGSKAVIDIEHPSQRGLTMRTIETLLSGKKLITTNSGILSSDLYHPSRVMLIDRNDPIITEEFLNSKFVKIENDVINKYLCKNWVKKIIY